MENTSARLRNKTIELVPYDEIIHIELEGEKISSSTAIITKATFVDCSFKEYTIECNVTVPYSVYYILKSAVVDRASNLVMQAIMLLSNSIKRGK
jgi:hypothetical protein